MPRIRSRAPISRPLCDCRACLSPPPASTNNAANQFIHRAARQEPPPRALILLVEGGIDGSILTSQEGDPLQVAATPHLDYVARHGCSTVLLTTKQTNVDPRLSTLYQLLGYGNDVASSSSASASDMGRFESMQDRYHGFHPLRAALLSSDPVLISVARSIQFSTLDEVPIVVASEEEEEDAVEESARRALDRALSMLGLGDDPMRGDASLVLLHLSCGSGDATSSSSSSSLLALDAALQSILSLPESTQSSLLTSILITSTTRHDSTHIHPRFLPVQDGQPLSPSPSSPATIPRPRQSYQIDHTGHLLPHDHLDLDRPILLLQHLPSVIRSDALTRASLQEAVSKGGGRVILADRWMHELTYKLGCSEKYGA